MFQSRYENLQPELCGKTRCVHGTKALLFYVSIYLLALGGGGIRGCVPALGADQFDDKNPKERIQLASFFNWFLFSITIGASMGVTFVVYVSTEIKWYKGFLISLSCSAAGLVFIAAGKSFYRTRIPGESPLLSVLQVSTFFPFLLILVSLLFKSMLDSRFIWKLFLQVLVVTVKNCRVKVPDNSDELYQIQSHGSTLKKKPIPHTNQFRLEFLLSSLLHPLLMIFCWGGLWSTLLVKGPV